jgi:DnaK suppressor protein
MNTDHYKQRLLDLEKNLTAQTKRALAEGRRQFIDSAHDAGDASVANVAADEDFTEAELDLTILNQVREALGRISAGTYGKCLVDGAPIGVKRLNAVPWAPYCLKHQGLIEAAGRART